MPTPPTTDRASAAPRAGLLAFAVAALYLACLLPRLGDFGPSWDLVRSEYPYGELFLQAELHLDPGLLDYESEPPLPPTRLPHPNFASGGKSTLDIAYPLGGMLSAVCCRVLWTWLGLVPAMAAHHVVVPLLTAALLAGLVLLGSRWHSRAAGVAAALLAALSPYFLTHSAFNLKDVPETCLYTWTYVALATALLRDRAEPGGWGAALRRWLPVGVLFGLALAQKPNALFLPVQGLVLLLLLHVARGCDTARGPPVPWRGLLVVLLVFPLVYLAVSPYEWIDTWARVARHWRQVAGDGTTLVRSDALIGLKFVLWTTPLPVLGFALLGLFDRRLPRDARLVLLVGLCVPLLRTLLPIRVHDGPRHFLEFFPMLCVWAGVGVANVLALWSRVAAGLARAALATATWAAALLPGGLAVLDTWPHGHCYFNALAGGLSGAQAADLPDATDNWCLSYWQGLDWISQHAEPHGWLLVPVGHHVAQSAEPLRLRRDVRLWCDWMPPPAAPLYVMAKTNANFVDDLMKDLARDHAPVHVIEVQGAPITSIYRLADADEAARVFAAFQTALSTPWPRLQAALAGLEHVHPELVAELKRAVDTGDRAALDKAVKTLRGELSQAGRRALDDALEQLPPGGVRPR